MGAYLSSPVREKESRDFDGDFLSFGASSMQGWRMTQEDAHSCQVDFDKDSKSSLFAVYDGHGGAEVAQYSSMHFPNYLKNSSPYAKGLINEALEEAFLGFDATLTEESVVRQLKELAGVDNDPEEADEEVKNEAAALCEEASMPLEKVLERYGGQNNAGSLMGKSIYSLRKRQKFQSPLVKSKADKSDEKENSPDSNPADTNSSEPPSAASPSSSSGNAELEEVKLKLEDKLVNGFCEKEAGKDQPGVVSESGEEPTSTEAEKAPVSTAEEPAAAKEISDAAVTSDSKSKTVENGSDKISVGSNKVTTSDLRGPVVDGVSSSETPSKAAKTNVPGPSISSVSPDQSGANKEDNSGEDTDEEEDPDSDDEEEKWNSEDAEDDSDDDDMEGFKFAGDDDDEDDDDDDDDDDDEEEEENMGAMNWNEEPGADSGCTAVVALLRGRTLYVANAGDSRCVLSRGGVAVEMSADHKPEDDPERDRIVNAGGKVTCDGRVNGGLNLSRALGDHSYKQNTSLGAREQMITSLPDIRTISLTEKDNFMVLACDGIWNVMSSQQVVDFVQKQLDSGVTKLSSICEEMFEACLAPDTSGDGTGCDNMTCVIVRFNRLQDEDDVATGDGTEASKKRKVDSDGENCPAEKRGRPDDCADS